MNESIQPQPTQAPPQAGLPASGLATASLVAGIAGFVMLPVLASIIALWTGYQARKETRSQPPRASGDGMATAGIVMGYIQLALACVGALCLIVYAVWFVFVIVQQG
jgi:uncharacterized membrane protein YqjE